jgi:predicted aspartyl protease
MAPKSVLEAIGLEPVSTREYELADGSIVSYEICVAVLEFEGVLVGNTVIFGEEGVEPLLAVTALESGGFQVDPRREELKRLPTARL